MRNFGQGALQRSASTFPVDISDPLSSLNLLANNTAELTGKNARCILALFIDGANLYATAKTLGFDIDYKRLLA
jgi:hypothetical protein